MDSRGRDALVVLESRTSATTVRYRTADDTGPVAPARLIKAGPRCSYEALRAQHGDDQALAKALLEGDPELDVESTGRRSGPCDRVWLDPSRNPLYAASLVEIRYGPDGKESERAAAVDSPATVSADIAAGWSGRSFKRVEALRRFAFTRKYQVRHTDGLTFDFLLQMASQLEQLDSMMLVGSGPKGTEPLILERNGAPYRGFLEGRTRGEQYLLILHLSNLELKRLLS